MPIDWEPLRAIIDANQRFVLTTHVRPDADALGSELAMGGILEHLGKTVRIVNSSAVPPRLSFLDPGKRCLQLGNGVTEEQALDTDVHIILDCSSWGQLAEMGRVYRRTKATKLVIDHHASSEDIGGKEFKDVTSEATGALVFQVAMALKVPVSTAMANAMYCAIATDTGWFRFPSTTSSTMRTIASLIDFGAQPALLYRQLYEQCTPGRIKLAGRVMARVTLECGGKLAHTHVEYSDYKETGADPSDTEDMVNYCLTIAGVDAAFIQIEQSNTQIKTSFRSRSHLDVNKVAEQFQGGGHRQAAGAILPGPLVEARSRVLNAMKTFVDNS